MSTFLRNLCLLALSSLFVGCGPSERTVTIAPDGTKVTSSQDGKEGTIETKDGKMEVKGDKVTVTDKSGATTEMSGTVSEADLGVPFYPGSETAEPGYKIESNEAKSAASVRSTGDSPAKVVEFYTDKLGKPQMTATYDKVTTATWSKDGKTYALIADNTDGKTKVTFTAAETPSK